MMYFQTIGTVRYLSRDDRARNATCSLRTPTDRLKDNYSIDCIQAVRWHYIIAVKCDCRNAVIAEY